MGFMALRCYACGMLQVKQEKKSSNKWSCAICNEKQSITKVYGTSGAAKDVRNLVQKLNFSSHVKEQGEMENALSKLNQPELGELESRTVERQDPTPGIAKRCKWDEYLDTKEKVPVIYEGENNYVTSLPERRNVKRNMKQAGVGTKKAAESHGKENAPESYVEGDVRSHLNSRATVSGSAKEPTSVAASATKQDQLNATSKWSTFLDAKTEKEETQPAQRKNESAETGFNKKWSKYLDEDGEQATFAERTSAGKWSKYMGDGMTTDSQPKPSTSFVGKEPTLFDASASKWSTKQDQLKAVTSKWSTFLDAKEDSQPKPSTASAYSKWSTTGEPRTYGNEIQATFEDEVVTDDIHPSFV